MDLSKRSNLGGAVLVIATSACPEAIGHAYPGCEVTRPPLSGHG